MAGSTVDINDVARSPVHLMTRDDAPHSDRARHSGDIVTVMRGVYAPASEWRVLKPWQRYLARVHAAAVKYPDAAFVLESAAALRRLPVFLEPPEIHVVRAPTATSREYSGVRIHTAQRLPAVEEIGGLLVATPAEVAIGIARTRHHAIGLATAVAAMRLERTITRESLAEFNAERTSSRGRRHARWVIDRATPVPESPLESVSLAAIEWLGFPIPELQKWILGAEDSDRLDFWWEQWRIGGEADGLGKYDGTNGDASAALRARSVRDARLMRRGVAAIPHWGWVEVRPAAQPMRSILISAGLKPNSPENTLELRTMQRAISRPSARQR